MQDQLMEIDQKVAKRMQKKLAHAMACLSDASIDATYIARFDETAAQRITKKAKEVQQLSRDLHNEFKTSAPMEIWNDEEDKEKKKEVITWHDK